MATLQKIRNRGKILIICVGLALFAFIAEEFVRSLSYTKAASTYRTTTLWLMSTLTLSSSPTV